MFLPLKIIIIFFVANMYMGWLAAPFWICIESRGEVIVVVVAIGKKLQPSFSFKNAYTH